jgi:hypothetical protein
MMVVSAAESGFSPDQIANSTLALQLPSEVLNRIRGTWNLLQLTVQSHDPMVYPALDFILACAKRMAELSEGVVADPLSQRYLLPEQVFHTPRVDPRIDARDHISVVSSAANGKVSVRTCGLYKFVQPELEITGLNNEQVENASRLLVSVAQGVLCGFLVQPGSTITSFEAAPGGLSDPDGSAPVLELIPKVRLSLSEALTNWESR